MAAPVATAAVVAFGAVAAALVHSEVEAAAGGIVGMAELAVSGRAAARGESVTAVTADLAVAAARPKIPALAEPSVDTPTLRMEAAAPAWVAPFSATAVASRSITARSTT